jgi:transketolase
VIEGELAAAGRERSEFLEEKANQVRRTLLEMVTAAGSGHPGGALSASDIMAVLFFDEMNLNANRPEWPDRDRFVLSKGHSAPVLYACLIEKGILKREEIGSLRKLGSRLQGHPDMRKAPGVEMSTGSLGQGLSVANGIALGIKQDEKDMRVYVLLGDGEMQEGQVWEAAMSSVHFRLDNLCAIIDYNGLQIGGDIGKVKSTLEPLVGKWESFGWYVIEINGHSFPEIQAAFRQARLVKGRPTVVIAHTIKGKGVSFMERSIEYHGKVPSFELLAQALDELKAD